MARKAIFMELEQEFNRLEKEIISAVGGGHPFKARMILY